MTARVATRGSRAKKRWWPVLLLLLAVIVPTVSMLWFMLAAIENERVAVRERLIRAYRAQLIGVKGQLAARLQRSAADLDRRFAGKSCVETFVAVVRSGEADSVICTDGSAPYPVQVVPAPVMKGARGWEEASRLERLAEFDTAARAFEAIATSHADVHVAARALQAQARCLSKDGQRDAAIAVLTKELAQPRYRAARDPRGRLIAPSAQLLALELLQDTDLERARGVADNLRDRLADYGDPVMPAPQRRFLMSELRRLNPETPPFDTQRAEDLAAEFLEAGIATGAVSELSRVKPSGPWQLVSPSGRIVALQTEDGLRTRLMDTVADADLSAGVTARLLQPGEDPDAAKVFVAFDAGESLSGWRLALDLDEQALVDAAAGKRITAYVWTGILVLVLIVAATGLIAGAIQRQLRVTQLKNDLLATVSHELKTPLASMRLLVETLLDGRDDDPQRVREYLELIRKENDRVSRLVESFLSFSRLERRRQEFDRQDVLPAKIAQASVAALDDRTRAPDCRFDVEIDPHLPAIRADFDALVTAVRNLLDNALKYTGDRKEILLRVYDDGDAVCFSVRDNGVGLSARARSKVFQRFYQVDQSLSRYGGGCGLGLSIVRLIVEGHDGRVTVDSEPGVGSTFTIRIPAPGNRDEASEHEELLVS